MKRTVLILAILALTGCSTPPPVPPLAAAAAPPMSPPAPQPVVDTCGAAGLQNLVGRPRRDVPVPVRPDLQRVACTTCPVTQDYNQNRLNFFFDAATGLIKEVRCG